MFNLELLVRSMHMPPHRPKHGDGHLNHNRMLRRLSEDDDCPKSPQNEVWMLQVYHEIQIPDSPPCSIGILLVGICCRNWHYAQLKEVHPNFLLCLLKEFPDHQEVHSWASPIRKEIPPHHQCLHVLIREPAGRTIYNSPVPALSGYKSCFKSLRLWPVQRLCCKHLTDIHWLFRNLLL